MPREQQILGLVDARRKEGRSPDIRVNPLHQAAVRLADVRRRGTRLKTKDLVGLLLGHGARAWRASLPPAGMRLRVLTPEGKAAVKIRFK